MFSRILGGHVRPHIAYTYVNDVEMCYLYVSSLSCAVFASIVSIS